MKGWIAALRPVRTQGDPEPSRVLGGDRQELAAVIGPVEGPASRAKLLVRDETLLESDLLEPGDELALALLDGADEFARFQQAVMRAHVEPGVSARHAFDMELAGSQIGLVDVRDLELAAGGRPDAGGDVHDAVVVEIEARDRPARLR